MNAPAITNKQPTTTITTEAGHHDLITLAREIRETHNKANGTARKALEYAAECGRLLIEAKKRVRHGDWTYWVSQRAGVSHRTATNYMRLASNWHRVADLRGSIRDTIKLLTVLDAPPAPPAPAPPAPAPPAPAPPAHRQRQHIGDDAAHEVDAVVIEDSEQEPPPAPAPARDPFLTILRLLPDLSQDQFREVIRIINERWLRTTTIEAAACDGATQ